MKIGFDLDNVYINTPPFVPKSVITRFYMKKPNGMLLYRIPSRKEQLLRLALHHPIFRQSLKKNMAFLNSLSQTEHSLYLISSRYGFLKNMTERIVKKYNLDTYFKELYFNYENKQPHIFKNEVIKKLKIDKFVDDDLYLLKYIAGRNNKVKLYWLNKKINKSISANIQAITDLADILNK